jgi:hypothetical protein
MHLHYEAAAHEAYLAHQRQAIQYGTTPDGPWSPTSRAWEAMMAKGEEHRWPIRHRNDLLLWDRQGMADDSRPCLWGLREGGTHVTRFYDTLKAIHATFGEGMIWHYWDGEALTPCTYEEALAHAANWS